LDNSTSTLQAGLWWNYSLPIIAFKITQILQIPATKWRITPDIVQSMYTACGFDVAQREEKIFFSSNFFFRQEMTQVCGVNFSMKIRC
jgi:hypothetical protein